MEAIEAILTRKSVRKFLDKEIEPEKVEETQPAAVFDAILDNSIKNPQTELSFKTKMQNLNCRKRILKIRN